MLNKVLGPDPRIRNLMAFPIGREVLGLKFGCFWIGFGKLGFEASPNGRDVLGLNFQ